MKRIQAKKVDSVPRFTNNSTTIPFWTARRRREYEYDDDDEPSNLHQLEFDSYAAFVVVAAAVVVVFYFVAWSKLIIYFNEEIDDLHFKAIAA